MGKKRGKVARTRKRSTSKTKQRRKVTRRVPIRKKKSRKTVRPKKKKQKSKSPSRRSPKRNTRVGQKISGNSTLVVVDSRKVGKNVTIVRKTTRFTPGIRISRGTSGARKLFSQVGPYAIAHYRKIGPSLKNFYYVRLQYVCKFRGKKVITHFSVGLAKIFGVSEFNQYVKDTCDSFVASLVGYSREGFSQIRVTALIVQGYRK